MAPDRDLPDPLAGSLLWRPSSSETTRLHQFKEHVARKHKLSLKDYDQLYVWSTENIAPFWEEVWNFTGVKASQPYRRVVENGAPMFPRPTFFEGAKLNYAENLLFPASEPDPDSLAIIAATEVSREHLTWRELRDRVRNCSSALRALGVTEGQRIAGYLGNHANTVIAALSCHAVGAIWTAVSPDTGVHAVLDRLAQIKPSILFSDTASIYNGKVHDATHKLKEILHQLPDLNSVIIFDTISGHQFDIHKLKVPSGRVYLYKEFLALGEPHASLEFAQLGPDHPVYILYSSGTTGKPKCIVHGSAGALLQHKKEHEIQCNIQRGDRFFQYTTCTWMMWHWLVSGLASGATIILYDGSPFRPLDETGSGDLAMPRLIDELGVTHFGTSAKYLSILEQKQVLPKTKVSMSNLRAIYSTASPLAASTFLYVYRAFGPDINLGSITGGTDIISLFGSPSTISPVFAGEVQVRGLGMAVQTWDFEGKDITSTGEAGDLVCVQPFPSQPVMFWNDPEGLAYRKSYFDRFPGVWHHGDFIKINPTTGGLLMLGRSDGVLNPAGIRFGSSEIYNILLKHYPQEVADAVCVGKRRETDADETVVLFLKMAEGHTCSPELTDSIKGTIRKTLTPRHVPSVVEDCPEIPVTTNGKKVEVAVKQILSGLDVKTSASVANAECLEWYRKWAKAN